MSVEPGNKFAICRYCCYITGPIINGDVEGNMCGNEHCTRGYGEEPQKNIAVKCITCSEIALGERCEFNCGCVWECLCETLNVKCGRRHIHVTVRAVLPKLQFEVYEVFLKRIPFTDIFQSNSQTKITAYFP